MAYTTIDDPSAFFNTVLYTGNQSTNAITNSANAGDFQPDWVWLKSRNSATHHRLYDSSRGALKNIISSAQNAEATTANSLTSFDSNGFTLGSDDNSNQNSKTFVGWQWKANGGTTTSFTESGSNPGGTYQANTTAGFSIVTYTGTGSAGTIAHGVGATPHWVLVKNRSSGSTQWYNQHISNSSASKGQTLSTNGAEQTLSAVFNDTRASSTVFSVGNNNSINDSGDNYVAYIFAPIKGYSKFGSYIGNGNADGPFVYTGFKPAFVIYKRIDSNKDWHQYDNKREPNNEMSTTIYPNRNYAEGASDALDFLSNGFKQRNTGAEANASGGTFIYIAFAEHPFVSSKGVPVTAKQEDNDMCEYCGGGCGGGC